jgi:hypothetical protein
MNGLNQEQITAVRDFTKILAGVSKYTKASYARIVGARQGVKKDTDALKTNASIVAVLKKNAKGELVPESRHLAMIYKLPYLLVLSTA